MTIDDVLEWIAIKNVEMSNEMLNNISNDENWNRLMGASNILCSLRFHILMKTNPHNREDIARANKAQQDIEKFLRGEA